MLRAGRESVNAAAKPAFGDSNRDGDCLSFRRAQINGPALDTQRSRATLLTQLPSGTGEGLLQQLSKSGTAIQEERSLDDPRELSGPEISLCGFPDPFQRMYETVHRDLVVEKKRPAGTWQLG
jgi:hypothetical protein